MASPARDPIRRARRGRPGDRAPYVRRSSERADDGRELVGVERRSAHESAVYAFSPRELADRARTHAPAVQNWDGLGVEAGLLERRADRAYHRRRPYAGGRG